MTTWSTYRPQDFLLFSETVYWRLFELLNQTWWPLPLVMPALGIVFLVALRRPRRWLNRALPAVLALLWCLVAVAFLWSRYAPINWAIRYVIPFFLLEAMLLLWLGSQQGRLRFAWRGNRGTRLGIVLFIYAAYIHPFTALLGGRPLAGAEVFGLAPDPTAIGTLGLVVSAGPLRSTWPLLIVPLLWCALSAITLTTLGTLEAGFVLISMLVALIAAVSHPRSSAG